MAGAQSAVVEGGDEQVDKGSGSSADWTNAAYPVRPQAHLCNPRASIYSREDMALCSNMQRAQVLLLPQVPCTFLVLPGVFQLHGLLGDLCLLLAQHQ